MGFYRELLMDHYRNPRNRGKIENPDFSTEQFNLSCGDSISIEGCFEEGVLTKMAFVGKGCVISQATASILTEFCVGKTVDELLAIDKDNLPDIIGMQLGPTRIKCAMLSLMALQKGVAEYKKK